MIRTLAAAALAAAVSTPAMAQENSSVAAFRDWSVFNPSDPRECYIVTPPTRSEAKRGGKTVEVRRGDILMFVTIRPAQGVDKEVSFTGGYPFADDSKIKVDIGGEEFVMAPGSGDSREWAWPPSPADDKTLVDAMRKGVDATVTAVSSRGTTTIDRFSLLGFTAALDKAEELCK